MTNKELKQLEDNLWEAANSLRRDGGIKASDYATPVLGIIFLKFADNKYSLAEAQILDEYERNKGGRMQRKIEDIAVASCGFYLPDHARYDHLLSLPGEKSMAKAIELAISGEPKKVGEEEKSTKGLEDYLDNNYKGLLPTRTYFEIEGKKRDILPSLLKTFSDIPKDASGDLFGKIYEYFLGKFALEEGQKGGEFFTPTSVVRFIVEVIEPYKGKIYDPACGSGGMFVQSATFLRKAKQDLDDIYVCGQEFMGETVRLAKMNLLVNNLRGDIREVNSYQEDPFESFGKFDYVMANPPFNVKSVKEGTVKDDPRFYYYGLPKNKGKKDDKISDANYLWISLFATSLNKKGRAGFVMPNSASDARNTQYDIREKIVDSGIVDCMVSMPSNMFFTVTLPATLWFFDKAKAQTDRKDKILFIDARNTFHQIDRAHREWTEEHQQNLATIVRLYRGETARYLSLIDDYIKKATESLGNIAEPEKTLSMHLTALLKALKTYTDYAKEKLSAAQKRKLEEANFFLELEKFSLSDSTQEETDTKLDPSILNTPLDNAAQIKTGQQLNLLKEANERSLQILKSNTNKLLELWKLANKSLKLKQDKNWSDSLLNGADKQTEALLNVYNESMDQYFYWNEQIQWLQKKFPDAVYKDVIGLCKVADREEYATEQDYSMNAGRYVGVHIEEENITQEEFRTKVNLLNNKLIELNQEAYLLEKTIESRIHAIIND